MLLAVRRLLDALDVEPRLLEAGIMCATPIANVDHVIVSMLLAVRPYLAVLEVEVRCLHAGIM